MCIFKNKTKTASFAIVSFWAFYWLFNSIDKFIGGSTYLWVGKDRLAQFVNYFSSIGVNNPTVAYVFLVLVTVLEVIAFIYLAVSLWELYKGNARSAKEWFFKGSIVGMIVFTFFGIGDQIFGDRYELMEHTIYWTSILLSWVAYNYLGRGE